MGFRQSPGVTIREIDLTGGITVESTTIGGITGQLRWGPLNEAVLIENENSLVDTFGKPDANTYVPFLCAASFLAYGNQLKVVRVADEDNALNATAEDTTGGGGTGTGLLVKNDEHYDDNYAGGAANIGPWVAKHAGALGNSLRVSKCSSSAAFSQSLTVSTSGTAMTGTSQAFDDKLAPGSIIIDSSGNQRVVSSVTDADNVVLASAFPSDLSGEAVTAKWQYHDEFDVAPGTSTYTSTRSGSGDEAHIIVIDEDGSFTGIAGTVLERFPFVSLASDAKYDDGSSAYYKDVINNQSQYIRWTDHDSTGSNWGSAAASTTFTSVTKPLTYSLAGGADGSAVDDADKIRGYNVFLPTSVDVDVIIGAVASATVANHVTQNICEVRKDCVATFSPESADVVDNSGSEHTDTVAFRNTLTSSSYGILDGNWKKMYDRHNDVYRWIPLNADVAGTIVRTDTIADPWFSPAGYNRGVLKNVVKLAYNPTEAQRDALYQNGVNPIINSPGQGFVLWGDKTLLSKPSAFDRINVRRLFIVLEKAIGNYAKFVLFEQNDAQTRTQFVNRVNPFLRDIKGRRGVTDFYVQADESVNTPEVIDRNEFIAVIYVKPTRSINFIRLDFVATRSGVDFSEIITGAV